MDKTEQGLSRLQQSIDHYQTADRFWAEHCGDYAFKTACTNMGSSLTYAELDTHAQHLAAYLQNCTQLEPGDRIAIQLPNVLQYPVIVQAAWRAGLVIVNTNPLYTATETIHQYNDAGVKAVVILANNAKMLEEVVPSTDVKLVLVTQLADLHPLPRRLFINLAAKFIRKIVPRYKLKCAVNLRDAFIQGEDSSLKKVELGPDSPALIQYSVGTTGVPKGALITHRNLLGNLLQIRERFNDFFVPGEEIAIAPLPLYHIYSFTFNCLFLPAYGAHIVLITNPRDTSGFVNELGRWPFSIFSGLNTLFVSLCQNSNFRQLDLTELKLTLSGGMALTQSVSEEWQRITGCSIIQGYGLTEASPVVAVDNPDSFCSGTVGKPLPYTEVRIVDELGNEMGPGESGEVYVRGPQVMPRYWNSDDQVPDKEGWLATGDIGSFTENGFLKIIERKKDIIKISGFPVYPNEIENMISNHPDIIECAVVGLPDETCGQVIKLFAVSSNHRLSVKQLRDYCRERLTSYKVPKLVEFRSHLPKSNVGKVLRRTLLEEEVTRMQKLRKHI
ncbi:AMP-binding protein [Neptuniibacter sp.]|uniref:AMP-binding protein n=1 Tax=Neptuniibacter sp. TaxID=1962643 RepID=UPI002612053F|nr:AMP-binding protein [Neptuniibacter sp.]MCP4595722.1 AMP-binding protein [Neptuniibacter sp.]